MGIRRLVFRLILFLLPFILTVSGAIALGVVSGEAMPLSMVYALQSSDPEVIYMPVTKRMEWRYKLNMISLVRPEVVVLGNSVMRYLRDDDFGGVDAKFYNAYVPRGRGSILPLLIEQLLKETPPKIAVIGITLQHFDFGDIDYSEKFGPDFELTLDDILSGTHLTIRQLIEGTQTLAQILSLTPGTDARRLGLAASQDGHGFRYDGSLWRQSDSWQLFHERLSEVVSTQRELLLDQIRSGKLEIIINPELLGQMLADIASLREADVEVVVVVMPIWMPSIMDSIAGTPLEAKLIAAQLSLAESFAGQDIDYIDLSDPRILGLTDEDIPDTIHLTVEATQRLLAEVFRQSSALRQYAPAGS